MGFFSKFFKKGEEKKVEDNVFEIYAPIAGEIIDLAEVPDEAFASGMIGDGVGLVPTEDGEVISAPCDAEDISIFDTNHAVSFETKDGLELIVHFGIDTVKLEGKGFERLGQEEGVVKKGQDLIKYDLEYIKKNAKSHRTPVIISSMDMVESIEKMSGKVKPGDLLMRVTLKK
jgi:glucose-specific phosphotransferase system IIA component